MVIMMYFIQLFSFVRLLQLVVKYICLYNIILYLSLYPLFIHYFYIFELFFLRLPKLLSIDFEKGQKIALSELNFDYLIVHFKFK